MDKFIERIYLTELLNQCDFALGAIQRMNALLASKAGGNVTAEFFREAGYFLQHSSAVSRLVWPPGSGNQEKRERATARSDHLRKVLEIDGDHPLKGRGLRDHIEHYDERVDDWAEASPNKNIVDYMIGPRSAIGGEAIKDSDIMRLYDPATKQFIFRGEPFNIEELSRGVADIHDRAGRRLETVDPRLSRFRV